MKSPDFLIIGAARSGTTSLLHNLGTHPNIEVYPSEIHYFSKKLEQGEEWYRSHFRENGKLQGEKSPTYIYYTECHQHMSRLLPDAKLILLLRNPIDRAYSNWNLRVNEGRLIKQGKRFNNAVPKQLTDLSFSSIVTYYIQNRQDVNTLFKAPLDIIHRGFYIDQIDHLLRYYDRQNLYIGITENFFQNEQKGYNDICRFLGIPFFYKKPFSICSFLRIPAFYRTSFKKCYSCSYSEMLQEETKSILQDIYRPYSDRLFDFLGYRIQAWEDI